MTGRPPYHERYLHDPAFHALVHSMLACMETGLTPADLIRAAELAQELRVHNRLRVGLQVEASEFVAAVERAARSLQPAGWPCPHCWNTGCTCTHAWGESCRCAAGGSAEPASPVLVGLPSGWRPPAPGRWWHVVSVALVCVGAAAFCAVAWYAFAGGAPWLGVTALATGVAVLVLACRREPPTKPPRPSAYGRPAA